VLDAAVEQSRARISNPDGRGPAIGRGPVGERRATAPPSLQVDPGDSDSSLPPPPLSAAAPCRECSAAGDAVIATATAESGAVLSGGVDAAALHALMQQMSVGVSSLNARLGAIENRMDGRGQQEQGSGAGGCCEVSASGSDAGQLPPARAPPEV
jgi:outer membrane murein-binding lipoprotein Lpp